MSRIGKLPIIVPADVDVKIDGSTVTVKGPKGSLSSTFKSSIGIELENGQIKVTRPDDTKENRSLHGLTRTLINNMIVGVHEGFKKQLEIVGIGYRAEKAGNNLVLKVGYSHDVTMVPPEGVTVDVPAPTSIVINGYDKQLVGQFASEVRGVRPPEPYKGKGIKYAEEVVRRKEGKAGKGGK
ncbi:MAG: 50S ribosomal protein L6 [Clostridia bacterium]|nr:50S ribosomal protein L6 [Clostridia bacterium]MBR5422761.1 50S ribosomal protein L6 [Clostridia bacterium]